MNSTIYVWVVLFIASVIDPAKRQSPQYPIENGLQRGALCKEVRI